MITWFQKTFGKHYKWALIAALGVLCLSTIVGIGAVPRASLTGGSQPQRMYLGLDLNSQQATQDVGNAVRFTNQSLSTNPVSSEQELQLLFDERLALTQLANQWQIPAATPKQVEDYLRGLDVFHDADGNFSPVAYTAFRDSIKAAEPAQRDLAVATINENCRLERVRQILGGPGYVLPYLAQTTAGLNKITLDLEATTLDFTKFEPSIGEVKDEVLQPIFEKSPDSFKKAAQARLSFTKVTAAAVGDPTPAQLHDYAVAHKDTFPNPDKLTDKDKTAATEAWRNEQKTQAQKDAGDTAMKFARELFDLKLARNTPEFAALLKKYNLTLQTLPLLEQGKPAPADSPIPDDVLQQTAFSELNAQQPFAPVQLADGTAILFLDEAIPGRTQTFAEAKDAVKAAYVEQQKEAQFVAHGQTVRDAIAKAVSEGKSFAAAAAAQSLTVKSYTDVNYDTIKDTLMSMSFDPADKSTGAGPLAAMGRDVLMALGDPSKSTGLPLLMTLQPNEVSPLVPANNVGVIFHVVKRAIPAVAEDSPEIKHTNEAFKTDESNRGSLLYLQRVIQSAQDSLKQAESGQG
jgi:hypothetical protein